MTILNGKAGLIQLVRRIGDLIDRNCGDDLSVYANHKVTAGIGRILHTILIRQIVKVIPVGFRIRSRIRRIVDDNGIH